MINDITELNNKIVDIFGSVRNYMKFINSKYLLQDARRFKQRKKNDPAVLKLIEMIELVKNNDDAKRIDLLFEIKGYKKDSERAGKRKNKMQ